MHLSARASEIRTEHNNPRRLVLKSLSTRLETVFKEFEITTTAVTTLLVFYFILNNQRLVLEINCLGESSGDGVVSGLVFGN
jgi:hypothetical protein